MQNSKIRKLMVKKSTFRDKVAIVTGSGAGIGKEIALALASRGARIVLNGRNGERLNAVLTEFNRRSLETIAAPGDVTRAEDCEKIVAHALEAFGRIDILVNNAGVTMKSPFELLEPEVFRQVVDVNLLGSAFMSHACLPHIRETRGSLVFISSIAGLVGLPTASAYCASKMALTGLAEALRLEEQDSGIHVGVIHVGFTENETGKRILDPAGACIPVDPRPAFLTQSREKVASRVLRCIRKRKRTMVLSPLGKSIALLKRFFPGLTFRVMYMVQRSRKAG